MPHNAHEGSQVQIRPRPIETWAVLTRLAKPRGTEKKREFFFLLFGKHIGMLDQMSEGSSKKGASH